MNYFQFCESLQSLQYFCNSIFKPIAIIVLQYFDCLIILNNFINPIPITKVSLHFIYRSEKRFSIINNFINNPQIFFIFFRTEIFTNTFIFNFIFILNENQLIYEYLIVSTLQARSIFWELFYSILFFTLQILGKINNCTTTSS